jgi:hypothetical protein
MRKEEKEKEKEEKEEKVKKRYDNQIILLHEKDLQT